LTLREDALVSTEVLIRRREAEAKEGEADRVLASYRDPLLRSAYDLQSRIYNIYRTGGFRGGRDPEYFRLNTLFLIAELLGWLEIIRREVQFLDLSAVQATKTYPERCRLCSTRWRPLQAFATTTCSSIAVSNGR
jgi:hypothetical protein